MSAPNKSFFSSLSGLITGIAALTTATIAIFGVAANQGWLSGSSNRATASPPGVTAPTTGPGDTTTTFGGAGSSGGGVVTSDSSAMPQYGVDASAINFPALGPTSTTIKVSNTGVVPISVQPPSITGPSASHFTAVDQGCGGSVDPGRSCQIQVSFQHAPGTFNATLVVQVAGNPRATEVPITASAIL